MNLHYHYQNKSTGLNNQFPNRHLFHPNRCNSWSFYCNRASWRLSKFLFFRLGSCKAAVQISKTLLELLRRWTVWIQIQLFWMLLHIFVKDFLQIKCHPNQSVSIQIRLVSTRNDRPNKPFSKTNKILSHLQIWFLFGKKK